MHLLKQMAIDISKINGTALYEKYFGVIHEIVENTTYLTGDEISGTVLKLVGNWLEKRDTSLRLVVLFSAKLGSQQWLYSHYENKLPVHVKATTADPLTWIDETHEVLVVDDFTLSGNFICSIIDSAICAGAHPKIFTVVVAAASDGADRQFESLTGGIPVDFHIGHKVPIHIGCDPRYEEYMQEYHADTDAMPVSAFVTDYKIPNSFGSYESLYKLIVDTKKPYTSSEELSCP